MIKLGAGSKRERKKSAVIHRILYKAGWELKHDSAYCQRDTDDGFSCNNLNLCRTVKRC